jgi:hypothetical protein
VEGRAMIWIPVVLAVIAAMPFILEKLRRPMNQRLRRMAEGTFIKLPQGVTHYRWIGPEDGPVAVCVHGLTTPSFVWQSVADRLAASGLSRAGLRPFREGVFRPPRGRAGCGLFRHPTL